MAFQSVFKRYELKYRITRRQKELIMEAMEPYMEPDRYKRTTIRNVYFDTDSYRLIRASVERPVYKEKLRVRSYEAAGEDSTVFVELKKKYNGVVFKRRIPLSERAAMDWLCGRAPCPESSQISGEIDYFLSFYGDLRPSAFISYDREAFYSKSGDGFRLTFDEEILFRTTGLSLRDGIFGVPLLGEGEVLMEVKCSGGIPLWLVRVLSEQHIYKTPFSKYGTGYKTQIFPQMTKASEKEQENIQNA